jgi:rsbT antagonist protein RsbS
VYETGSRAVILDVSGLETLDAHEFAALRRIIRSATIMGSESVLVGLQPGVVSALIEVDADVDGLKTAIDLDAAFALLEQEPDVDPEADSDSELGSEPYAEPEPGLEAMDAALDEQHDFLNQEPER